MLQPLVHFCVAIPLLVRLSGVHRSRKLFIWFHLLPFRPIPIVCAGPARGITNVCKQCRGWRGNGAMGICRRYVEGVISQTALRGVLRYARGDLCIQRRLSSVSHPVRRLYYAATPSTPCRRTSAITARCAIATTTTSLACSEQSATSSASSAFVYPGSYVHLTPSLVFPRVCYVDSVKGFGAAMHSGDVISVARRTQGVRGAGRGHGSRGRLRPDSIHAACGIRPDDLAQRGLRLSKSASRCWLLALTSSQTTATTTQPAPTWTPTTPS